MHLHQTRKHVTNKNHLTNDTKFILVSSSATSFHIFFSYKFPPENELIGQICICCRHRSAGNNELEDLLALENRIESVMNQLGKMQKQVASLKRGSRPERLAVVIEADPRYPPKSISPLVNLLASEDHASVTMHSHSSLGQAEDLTRELRSWFTAVSSSKSRMQYSLNVTFIWKSVGRHPVFFVNRPGSVDVHGQASIARLLARLIEALTGSIVYESLGNRMAAQIDDWMDLTQTETLARDGRLVTDRMEKRLQQAQWLAGDGTGCKYLADVYLAAVLKDQLKSDRLKQWALRSS